MFWLYKCFDKELFEEEEEEKDKSDWTKTNVKIKVLNIAWMFKEKKSFLHLAKKFSGKPNSVYESLFIKAVFEEFWLPWQLKIIKS